MDKQTAYKRELIKNLYFKKALSCADLSILTTKSIPFTTKFLNELISEGIVIETGFAHSTGGRRAQTYSLKQDLGYVVCVAMDQLITNIGMLDMHNNIVCKTERINLPLKNNEQSLQQLRDNLLKYINDSVIPY